LKINKIYNLNAEINKKVGQESIPTLHHSPEQRLQRTGESNYHNIIEIGPSSIGRLWHQTLKNHPKRNNP